jgi:excisionase family DNA binding protein
MSNQKHTEVSAHLSALADEIRTALREVLRDELPRLVAGLLHASRSGSPARIGVAEAAALSNRHPDTVRRAIKKGRLRAARPSGARVWVIETRDVERWVRGDERDAKADMSGDVEAAVARALDARRH